jgi:hypothetical protein
MTTSTALVPLAFLLALGAAGAHASELLVPQQFATIQAAIDASFAGDIIRVAPGTYSQSLTFANRPDRAVVGIGKVILDAPAAIDAITITNSSYVRLENLRIRGGTDDGIEVDALSESVKLRKLVIEACGDDGIVSAGDAGWIENVTVRDCDDAGVFVSGDAVYLANVAVKQVGGRGIIVAGARNIVTRSKVDTSGADGIVVLGSESMNLVSECDTRSCDGHSLWIAAATSDNLVRDSRARDSASTGLKAQGLGSVVIGNKVRDATSIGIDCAGPAIAVANEVKNTKGGAAYQIESTSDAGIHASNKLSKSAVDGVLIGATATGNLIARNTSKGAKAGFDINDASSGQNALLGNSVKKLGP